MFLRRAVVRGRTLPIQTMLRRIKSRNRRPSIRFGTRGPQVSRIAASSALPLEHCPQINPRKRIRSDDETNLGSGAPRVMGSITPL
jgi:hypothetical protein